MKLFTKSVLFISVLIVFQASLTGLFVSNIIRNNNLDDARTELRREADFINHNFFSWKRHLWKQLIRIRTHVEDTGARTLEGASLSHFLTATSVDAVIVKSGGTAYSIEAISTSPDFRLPPVDNLTVLYDHPYIRLYRIEDQFYMMGTLRLESLDRPSDIFLIKHVNDSFLKNIVFDTGGRVVFHTADAVLAGNFPDGEIVFHAGGSLRESAYREFYAVPRGEAAWNIAVSKCGTYGDRREPEIVYLSTVLSDEPFRKRILDIEKTVLTVSLFTMFITILLSILISRGFSRPVRSLVGAMNRIRGGSYEIRLDLRARDEFGVLVEGFNEMAAQLHQDQVDIERSLKEITFLNEYNEQVFNSIRDSIAVINESMKIEKANPYFTSRFPGEAGPGESSLLDLNSSAFDESVISSIRSVIRGDREFWSQRIRDREDRIYELKVYPLHAGSPGGQARRMCVLLLEDISEKNAYEEKIFQAEKLSSISMLSAGIAHEINNPLSSILTNIQNLIYSEQDGLRLESLKLVEDETLRIAQIVRDLLDFTSREQARESRINPETAAHEVRRLIRHARKPGGERMPPIEVESSGEIPPVAITKGELMQIFINLLQNAVHASGPDDPITLSIGEGGAGRVRFSVRDRGVGIDSGCLKRVFDPFFTTKANREGTGLGLSVVYGIIMKYEGTIQINSIEGEGTDVVFELPAVENRVKV